MLANLDTLIAFTLANLDDAAQFETIAAQVRAARPLTADDLSLSRLEVETDDRIVEARKVASAIRALRIF